MIIPTNPTYLTKEDAKARRIILYGVNDHIVPHIIDLDTMKKVWDVILNMYKNAPTNKKLIIMEKLRNTRMNDGEDIVSYLTRLRLIIYELVVVGNKLDDCKLI